MKKLPRNVFTTCPKEEASQVVPNDEFNIYTFKDLDITLLLIVKHAITMEDIAKAAKCASLDSYYITKLGGDGTRLMMSELPIKDDIVIHKKIVPVLSREYKIFNEVTGQEVMIVKGEITFADVNKAVKCTKIPQLEVYFTEARNDKKLIEINFPIRNDIVIRKIKRTVPRGAPEVFHVCESTSIAPVKKSVKKVVPTPLVVKVSAKRKLIRSAIKGLQAAIEALNELEAII